MSLESPENGFESPETGPDAPDDDIKSVELEVVREEHRIRRDPWRPTTLTVRKFLTICHLVEEGEAITHACRQQLISYSRFRYRVARSPRLQERLRQAETCRDHLMKAEALSSLRNAFAKNWVAAMTFLERKWPNEFSLRRVDRDTPGAEKMIGNEISEDRVQFYTQIMAEEVQKILKKTSPAPEQ